VFDALRIKDTDRVRFPTEACTTIGVGQEEEGSGTSTFRVIRNLPRKTT
jgi:hypothetical protein